MDPKHREVLKQSRVVILSDLDPSSVIDHLFSCDVLRSEDEERIRAEPTRESQVRRLLQILPTRGAEAYQQFLTSLEETEQSHIKNYIEDIENNLRDFQDAVGEVPITTSPQQETTTEEESYDVYLIYDTNKDQENAFVLSDLIEEQVTLKTGRHPKVCMQDSGTSFPGIRGRFAHLNAGIKNSRYIFLFVTTDFLKDKWAEMGQNAALAESLDNPEKRWSVVPLFPEDRNTLIKIIPSHMRDLRGLDMSRFLRGQQLQNIKLDQPMMGNKHFCRFLKSLTATLNTKLNEDSLVGGQCQVTEASNIAPTVNNRQPTETEGLDLSRTINNSQLAGTEDPSIAHTVDIPPAVNNDHPAGLDVPDANSATRSSQRPVAVVHGVPSTTENTDQHEQGDPSLDERMGRVYLDDPSELL